MAVGQVIRSHSNIYYVLTEGREVECRPRGRFRLDKQSVLAGDLVEVQLAGEEGRIDKVLPRRTVLERPAIANVDQAVILFTLREPEADYPFLDRVLIHVERAGVAPVILLNKIDLLEPEAVAAFCQIYGEQVGYAVYPIAARDGVGLDVVRPLLAGKLSVLAGHSGVGKSHLVRSLEPGRQDVRVGTLREAGPWEAYHPPCGADPDRLRRVAGGHAGLYLPGISRPGEAGPGRVLPRVPPLCRGVPL